MVFLNERKESGVDLVGEGPGNIVRAAFDRDKRAVGDERGEPGCRRLEGNGKQKKV